MNELKKSIHDNANGLDYTLVNDHYLPNLTAAAPAEHPTGRWGRVHKKYQKTAGENRKKKRAALREAARTDPQAAAEYEALLQKGRERCRKYAQNKKLAQQESADTVPIQFEPSEEMKGESA